ncbi:MAG TPA: alpha/beta hydrolase [Rhodopila sp.]|uniref:alpha/beta fold hydrolase n=1 Tax=Rhodopila sp. TaxID=2480087 RepID=UPI002D19BE8C|nr:alpha/beta hydrolase [Rhodopila sp.]HVY16967.1 alpha/beta hydrolase [Rhodopila sp.]
MSPIRFAFLGAALIACILGSAPPARAAGHPPEAVCAVPPPTAPIYADVRQQIAGTPYGPIAYYRFGHGSPILLVTGYRADVAEWSAAFLSELAKQHEVIVFDNRGVGRSIPQADSFTVEDMAQDTAALIDVLKLRRPVVVGWSMGGAIVQQLAIDDGYLIGKMVLLSTLAPGKTGVPVPPNAQATLSGAPGVTFDDAMTALFPPAAVTGAERCFRKEMYRPDGYRPGPIPSAVSAGQAALLTAWYGDEAAATSLKALHVPTLILSGSADDIVSPRNAQALGHLLAGSRVVMIGGGGHAMMYQYPATLAREISRFAGS